MYVLVLGTHNYYEIVVIAAVVISSSSSITLIPGGVPFF